MLLSPWVRVGRQLLLLLLLLLRAALEPPRAGAAVAPGPLGVVELEWAGWVSNVAAAAGLQQLRPSGLGWLGQLLAALLGIPGGPRLEAQISRLLWSSEGSSQELRSGRPSLVVLSGETLRQPWPR